MSAYKRSAMTETLRVDDEWIVMHTDRYTITTLNDAGGYCWSLLDRELSVGELAAAVSSKYERLEDEVSGEIEDFLRELAAHGLVESA